MDNWREGGPGVDQNAAACARAGVARVRSPDVFTPESVAEELATLLSDPRYSLAAQRVRGEIAAMVSPAAVVPLLEDLVSESCSHPADALDAEQRALRNLPTQP